MKNSFSFIRFIVLLLILPALHAQAQSPRLIPVDYPYDAKVSFIRTWDALAPDTVINSLIGRPTKDVRQTTQYFDGLGRPLQTVVKKGSMATGGDSLDLVSAFTYDPWGREQWKYLSFPANDTAGNTSLRDGLLKLNPFPQQVKFYNRQLAGQAGETNVGSMNLNWAYAETVYELSSLVRPVESFAPGASWIGSSERPTEATRRSVKTKYWINTTTDSVRIWQVTDSAGKWGSYATTGIYGAGELTKSVIIDEQGKQVIEFRDKQELMVLKKVQLIAAPDTGTGKGHAGWLSTYYIYDKDKNLRCVVQPKGVELMMGNGWLLTSTLQTEQCFRTEYDVRNRPIRKKAPGGGEVWTVYDKWDRPVLTQDANMRTQYKWLFTKYDGLGRVIMTGVYTNTVDTTLASMQLKLNTLNLARFENYTPAGSLPLYSLNLTFPVVTYADVLTVNWYDDYNWVNAVPAVYRSFDNTFSSYFLAASNTAWPYPQAVVPTSFAKGLRTGGIVKTTDRTTEMAGTIFYDRMGRVIQTKSQILPMAATS